MISAMLAASQLPGGGPVHDGDDAPAYNKSNTLIKNQIKHFYFCNILLAWGQGNHF